MYTGIKFFSENLLSHSAFIGIFDHFDQIQDFYTDILNTSINDHIKNGSVKQIIGKDFYNYLLIDADKFQAILNKYKNSSQEISIEDFKELKKCIFYVGKGHNCRKYNHLIEGKKLLKNKLKFSKISSKFSKITRIWEQKRSIFCLQILHETCHYTAHCREFAIIKALGFNNLTNENSGVPYGDMKFSWNNNEIVNFGDILLYKAFKICMIDNPTPVYHRDVALRTGNARAAYDWEIAGILEFIFEM